VSKIPLQQEELYTQETTPRRVRPTNGGRNSFTNWGKGREESIHYDRGKGACVKFENCN